MSNNFDIGGSKIKKNDTSVKFLYNPAQREISKLTASDSRAINLSCLDLETCKLSIPETFIQKEPHSVAKRLVNDTSRARRPFKWKKCLKCFFFSITKGMANDFKRLSFALFKKWSVRIDFEVRICDVVATLYGP